jgi:hypothetical protein
MAKHTLRAARYNNENEETQIVQNGHTRWKSDLYTVKNIQHHGFTTVVNLEGFLNHLLHLHLNRNRNFLSFCHLAQI